MELPRIARGVQLIKRENGGRNLGEKFLKFRRIDRLRKIFRNVVIAVNTVCLEDGQSVGGIVAFEMCGARASSFGTSYVVISSSNPSGSEK